MTTTIGLLVLSIFCCFVYLWSDHEYNTTRNTRAKQAYMTIKVINSVVGLLSMFIALVINL